MSMCSWLTFGFLLTLSHATEALAQGPSHTGTFAVGVTEPAARQPSLAFPEGARIGYVDLDRVAAISAEGKAATAKLQALRDRKAQELAVRGKEVEALQHKLADQSTLDQIMRARLQREFQRAQLNHQRMAEDAQSEVQELQQELSQAFNARLFPVIGEVAKEKKLWAVFGNETGLLWYDPDLDLSEEVAKRLDRAAVPKP